MPIAAIGIGLGTAIAGGAAAAATVYGSRQQSRSDREASRIEAETARRAEAEAREQRDYERAQYDAYLSRLSPYRQMGTDAMARLNGVAASYGRQGSQPSTTAGGPPTSSTRPTGARMEAILLEAPNGQRRAVPAHQADHYIARGARRVQ